MEKVTDLFPGDLCVKTTSTDLHWRLKLMSRVAC